MWSLYKSALVAGEGEGCVFATNLKPETAINM